MTIDIMVPSSGQGGVERVLNMVALFMKKSGYRVRVVQFVYEGPYWLDESIEFYPLLINQKVEKISEFAGLYAQFVQQTATYPDVIIATPWPYLTLVAKAVLKIFPNPCKVISWMHGPLEEYMKYGLGGIECLEHADGHIVLNERTKKQLMQQLPQAQVQVVYNPIDFEHCEYVNHSMAPNYKLLYVGRLSLEKRVDVIIEAISMAKGCWSLEIIGDGVEKEKLIAFAKQKGVENQIIYTGWKEYPWEEVKDVSALVLASEYESYSLVAREAMACGIPVISTPVDGIIELIRPGENGYLYSKNQPQELAEILNELETGVLPELSSQECHESVKPFEKQQALKDFMEKFLLLTKSH